MTSYQWLSGTSYLQAYCNVTRWQQYEVELFQVFYCPPLWNPWGLQKVIASIKLLPAVIGMSFDEPNETNRCYEKIVNMYGWFKRNWNAQGQERLLQQLRNMGITQLYKKIQKIALGSVSFRFITSVLNSKLCMMIRCLKYYGVPKLCWLK